MNILVLNCGSSSIKYQLLDMTNEPVVLAKGLVDRIGIAKSELSHKPTGKDAYKIVTEIPDHQVGINLILEALLDPKHGVIKDRSEIHAVGHRVAHGGENFKQSVLIDEHVISDIDKCCELAPLHNPANLKGITSMERIIPGIKQVAVFDTSFHQTMPQYAYMYAIPYEYYQNYKIRRYGFHGTSYRYVAEKTGRMLNRDWKSLKIIACHLGNGASICAIQNGKSVDTSMGFTPVEGLMMGTRAGDLDLGALLYLMDKEKFDCKESTSMINKLSGVHGISGISSDMRDVTTAMEAGHFQATLALEMYAYRVKKYIGSYAAAMGGVDVILFTGGIGENDRNIRAFSMQGLEFLGVDFDFDLNLSCPKGSDQILSKSGSKVAVIVATTNEEHVIAQDAKEIVFGN